MQSVVQVRVWEERITVFEFRIGSYCFPDAVKLAYETTDRFFGRTEFLSEAPTQKRKKVLHKNMNRATKFTKVSGETLEAL
uniref:Uncharacterized protein n=1 Tax=Anguilla anguilla TaxID=7936 RepID=A0A0E9RUJ6_ANGAN